MRTGISCGGCKQVEVDRQVWARKFIRLFSVRVITAPTILGSRLGPLIFGNSRMKGPPRWIERALQKLRDGTVKLSSFSRESLSAIQLPSYGWHHLLGSPVPGGCWDGSEVVSEPNGSPKPSFFSKL